MLVRVDELAGQDRATKDLNLAVPPHGMHGGMPHAHAAGQSFEPRIGHLINVAHGSIHDGAHTTERTMDVRIHLAPKGTDGARLVEILHDHDLRPWQAGDVGAVLVPRIRIGLAVGRIARLYDHRHRIAHHGSHLRHEVAGFFDIETIREGILHRDLLPAIVDGGSVPALELEEFGMWECHGEIDVTGRTPPRIHR